MRIVLPVLLCVTCLVGGCSSAPGTLGGPCADDTACDDGNPCTADTCDGAVGCVNDGTGITAACSDDDVCTTADVCLGDAIGTCAGLDTTAIDCDDGNPCTADACDPTTGCFSDGTGVTTGCSDGNACTTGDVCLGDAAGTCLGVDTSVSDCDDANPCTTDSCGKALGCRNDGLGITTPCSDGDACTTSDVCLGDAAGTCLGADTSASDCDDTNPCTTDSCGAADGCHNDGTGVTIPCSDGDACTTADACLGDFAGTCQGNDTSATDCDDTNPCTADSCDAATGCSSDGTGITSPCDDADACTTGDACLGDAAGTCQGTDTSAVDCDDANSCTADSCDAALGCFNDGTGITSPCDDADACTTGDACLGDGVGTCQGIDTSAADCDDASPCTADSCDSAVGCVNDGTGITTACADRSVCTTGDVCLGDAAGTCQGVDTSATDCDDGNACTADSCHPTLGCDNTLIQSFACRPAIVVTFPLRAATVVDDGTLVVMVTGSVASGAGAITTFTLNGQAVTVNPDDSFAVAYNAQAGANVLAFAAADSFGTTEERVQSFHLSPSYTQPDPLIPGNDPVDPGMGFWLSQQTFDDGLAPPPMDFAAIFEGVLAGFDLSTFFDPATPIASSAGYDIYLTSLAFADTTVSLQASDGGLHITAALLTISGGLLFDCTTWVCLLAGGSSTGGLTIDSIDVDADIIIGVNPDHTLSVAVANTATTINNINLYSNNGWTDFLLGIVQPLIINGVVTNLETELSTQLSTVLGPMLQSALSALAFAQSMPIPRLDGAVDAGGNPIVITVDLMTDFSYTDFQDANPGPQGGVLGLRAWATTPTRAVPVGVPFDDNIGIPMRAACGVGTQVMVVPRLAPMEIMLADDTLNQILHAAWWGGLLEFPIDPAMLGGIDFASYGITNLALDVSGWLPPLASDCGAAGDLRMYVGDLRLDASMLFAGQPLDLVVFVSFEAPLTIGAANNEITLTVQALENAQLETHVVQESMLTFEPIFRSLLATELIPALSGMLGAGQTLAALPLPQIDLSSALGQPPGTTVIAIQTLAVPPASPRQDGNTVIYGQLQ